MVCVAGVCEGPRIKVAEAYSLFSEYPREGINGGEVADPLNRPRAVVPDLMDEAEVDLF